MNSSVVLLLVMPLLIIAGTFSWVMLHRYGKRLSRINEELRSITVMLSEIPKETSLKEYIFAQDQRLRDIGDKLDTYPDTDMMQQCIQDQANQVIAFVSTHSKDGKSRITKEDLKVSLQEINRLLERVLWSLRFDEDKYAGGAEADINIPIDQDKKNTSKLNTDRGIHKDINDNVSMEAILEGGNDDYDAMLQYMQQSGKCGVEAQQALNAAKIMRASL